MALTESERAQVRLWLAFPDPLVFPRTWGYAVTSSLETNMSRIGPETEALVRKTLLQLQAIDDGAYGDGAGNAGAVAQGGLESLGQNEIKWFKGGAMEARLSAIPALVRRLAGLLGLTWVVDNGVSRPIPLE